MIEHTHRRFAAPRSARPVPVPRVLAPLAILPLLLPLAACTGAPALNVVGSFFPSWMLCGIIGIAAAVCFRQVLVLIGLEDVLVAPLLTHALVALAVTLAVWLLFFGH
ncbi:MAG: hypothetical protein INR65_12645 [Gluconacetobacter diazotrophicus]|nr:hypothetical protein [Gluconacetobacter diazotrophicus]